MFVEAMTFERHLQFLADCFQIVNLSGLPTINDHSLNGSSKKPLCAITFDDGWHDTYLNAFPALRKFGVPATVFLPTQYIGTNEWFWSDRVARLLHHCHKQKIPLLPDKLQSISGLSSMIKETQSGSFEERLEQLIGSLKTKSTDQIEAFIEEVSAFHRLDPTPSQRAFMNWEEAKEMHDSGLIEFGSHTHTHPILTNISIESVKEEIIRSKSELVSRGQCDENNISFCYPNGNFTPEIAREVQKAGYFSAVTTRTGWNGPGADSFALNRIGMHQDVSSTTALFAARIARLF